MICSVSSSIKSNTPTELYTSTSATRLDADYFNINDNLFSFHSINLSFNPVLHSNNFGHIQSFFNTAFSYATSTIMIIFFHSIQSIYHSILYYIPTILATTNLFPIKHFHTLFHNKKELCQ